MQHTIENITPEVAREYLKRNTENRKLRKRHVENIARDIEAGNFALNGETIIFSDRGELMNGQHRLHAVIKASKPIQALVVRGVPKSARSTMDAGAKRSVGDHMTLDGIPNAYHIAAACRYAISARQSPVMRPVSLTNSEIADFYRTHRAIGDDIAAINKRSPRGMGSYVAACLYATCFANHGFRDELLSAWVYGEGGRDHPCVVARERSIRDTLSGKRLIPAERIRLVAQSMVLALEGRRVQRSHIPSKVWIPGWTVR